MYKLLLALLCFTSFSCPAQNRLDAILIGQSSGGGYRNSDNAIAMNKTDASKVGKKFKIDGLFLDESIVSQSIYKYVKDYMLKNCVAKNTANGNTSAFLVIRICTNESVDICYLIEKEQIVPYFTKLIKNIKGLSKSDENEDLIKMFENIVASAF